MSVAVSPIIFMTSPGCVYLASFPVPGMISSFWAGLKSNLKLLATANCVCQFCTFQVIVPGPTVLLLLFLLCFGLSCCLRHDIFST
jgi:O-antigen ligase